jgi:hypothetical protein
MTTSLSLQTEPLNQAAANRYCHRVGTPCFALLGKSLFSPKESAPGYHTPSVKWVFFELLGNK